MLPSPSQPQRIPSSHARPNHVLTVSGLRLAGRKFPLRPIAWPMLALALMLIGSLPLLLHPEVGIVFRQTASVALGVSWRALILGAGITWALSRAPRRERGVLIALIVAWAALPLGTQTIAWKSVWQDPAAPWHGIIAIAAGFWNQRPATDSASVGLGLMRGEAATIWVHVLAITPWWVAILSWFRAIRVKGLEELAALEGKRWSSATLQRWGVAFWLMLALLISSVFGEMTASDVFALRTYAEEIYLGYPLSGGFAPIVPGPLAETQPYRFPWFAHFWANGGLTLGLAAGLYWSSRVGQRLKWEPRSESVSRPTDRVLAIASVFLIGSLLAVPAVHLLQQAGRTVELLPAAWGEQPSVIVSWQATTLWQRAWEVPWRLRQEFQNSLAIAGLATLLALIVGQGLVSATRNQLMTLGVIVVVAACLAIPAPLLGVVVVPLRNWGGAWSLSIWDRSLTIPVVLLAIKLLPLAMAGLGLIAWQIPRSLNDLARLETPHTLLRWYRLQLRPHRVWYLGLVAALLLVALTDIGATNLVLPPGIDTLARRLLGMVHAGVDDQVAVITLEQGVVALLLGVGIARLSRRV